jgi:haloacetate dehalogenase
MSVPTAEPFAGFEALDLPTARGAVHALVAGSGPPVLLLHGYPQSHLMWREVAPLLTAGHTVVATDLAGYGDSFRPAPTPDHAAHGKRALALDQVEAMRSLGFERFAVVGHDRGGRVAYRMALDHPDQVERLAALDVVPTGEVWGRADGNFARGYWHWAFLALSAPLPERLIGGDPQAFFDLHVRAGMGLGQETARYPAAVMDDYRRALDDPGAVEAVCEDYRAGATVDVEHDDADRIAGRQIACPTLVLWAGRGGLPRFYPDVLDVWRPWAPDLQGRPIDATHFMAEDRPEEVAATVACFLRGDPPQTREPGDVTMPPSTSSTDALTQKLKRTELQRSPSSVPGREIVQVLTEIPAGVQSGWHMHPGEEVGYILAGTVEMQIQGQPTLTLHAGDPFLMPPRTPHNATDHGPDTGQMLSTYIVELDEPLATLVDPS